VEDGYEVQVVVDAGGSPTMLANETSTRRMERHGVTLTSTNQVMNWLSPGRRTSAKRFANMYEEILSQLIEDCNVDFSCNNL